MHPPGLSQLRSHPTLCKASRRESSDETKQLLCPLSARRVPRAFMASSRLILQSASSPRTPSHGWDKDVRMGDTASPQNEHRLHGEPSEQGPHAHWQEGLTRKATVSCPLESPSTHRAEGNMRGGDNLLPSSFLRLAALPHGPGWRGPKRGEQGDRRAGERPHAGPG